MKMRGAYRYAALSVLATLGFVAVALLYAQGGGVISGIPYGPILPIACNPWSVPQLNPIFYVNEPITGAQGPGLFYCSGYNTWTAASGGTAGTVTSFSSGSALPLFTTNVATATSTPSLTYGLANFAANLFYAGPTSGPAATPTARALVAADLPPSTYFQVGYANAALPATANTVSCVGVVIPPGGLSDGHVVFGVNTGDAIHNYDWGIYSATGTLEAHIGAQDGSGTGDVAFAFSGGTQSIAAGKAYECITSAGSTFAAEGAGDEASFYNFQSTGISSSGGALPGSITPPADAPKSGAAGTNGPVFVLYP
jgi:hypothetical protein